jgi:hypothetical protein
MQAAKPFILGGADLSPSKTWEVRYDDYGQLYYYRPADKKMSWIKPKGTSTCGKILMHCCALLLTFDMSQVIAKSGSALFDAPHARTIHSALLASRNITLKEINPPTPRCSSPAL